MVSNWIRTSRRWEIVDPKTLRIRISLCISIRFWMVSTGFPRPFHGKCRKTCRDHPHWCLDGLCRFFDTIKFTFINIYISWNGCRKTFETIQNLMLMHKLIRIHSAFLLTRDWKEHGAKLKVLYLFSQNDQQTITGTFICSSRTLTIMVFLLITLNY